MTLLDDLQALDLSAIIDAKADISLTLDADALASLVGNGAATSVLGDLGVALQAALDSLDDPSVLVAPITAALTAVLDEISAELPLAEYLDAVTAAAGAVAELVGILAGDPNRISFGGSLGVGSALERVGDQFGDHAAVVSGNLARFRALVESVERGLPSDPAALVGSALQILLPFPASSIDEVFSWSQRLSGQLDAVTLDPRLSEGLVAAFGAVRVAAQAGDPVALQDALTALAQVRASTVAQLAAALRSIAGAISGLRVTDGIAVLHELRATLSNADDTAFELLDGWRDMIAQVRQTVTAIDPAAAMAFFAGVLDQVEAAAGTMVIGSVDQSVELVKQWIRDLLREIPLRRLRLQLGEAIAGAASAIGEADLDAPVEAVRTTLASLATLLADADPAAMVQAAVAQLEAVVGAAIDELAEALGRITAGIDAVAAQAQSVLERAVAGVRDFADVVEEITVAIENAGIAEAAASIAAELEDLRENVSRLLSGAPVPDALRAAVDQLVTTLEAIDLDAAIGGPLREVAEQLQIPADVATTVQAGLEAIAQAVSNLVPDDVIADLQTMMDGVLAELTSLDVSQLTSGVTGVLETAAGVFEDVRFTELVAPASAVYEQITRAVDQVHPRTVLQPAITLYTQVVGAIPLPDPETMATRAGTVASHAGEAAARAAAEPARRAVSSAATLPPTGDRSSSSRAAAPEEPPADLRPGDIVRLVGFLPAKLRDALGDLDDEGAGEVLAALDRQFSGSAAALRDVRDRLVGLDAAATAALDAALAPITAAQIDAQLAVQGSAALSAGGLDVDASFTLLADAGPAALQAELAGERDLIAQRCQLVGASLVGAVAEDLDRVADLLDAVLPSDLVADVDALLAALDPEPIAAELDALLVAVVDATPGFLAAAEAELRALEVRVRGLIDTYNPGALMQRYLGVLDVVREELSLLDPARLADELGEVHARAKAAVRAYDPLVVAGDLDALLAQLAAAVRGLDPANLMPDLTGITSQAARVGDILPANALADVGAELEAVGAELRALDVQGMLDAVNALPLQVTEAVTVLIESVRRELVALLKSIRYAAPQASASVSVSGGVG